MLRALAHRWQKRAFLSTGSRARRRRTEMNQRAAAAVEHLEERTLLSGNGFLQGIAFYDTSNAGNGGVSGKYDSKDELKAGATITLQRKDDTTGLFLPVAGQSPIITSANGAYRFEHLSAGVYRITETPPSNDLNYTYSNVGTDVVNSQISPPASQIGNNTIEVTLFDPMTVTFDYPAWIGTGQYVNSNMTLNGNPIPASLGQLPLTISAPGFSTQIKSLCVALTQNLSGGVDVFDVSPTMWPTTPGSSDPREQALGRIGYLFNVHGQENLTKQQAAGLQLAAYELLYDYASPGDFSSGAFTASQYSSFSSADFNAAKTAALAYIAESAGMSQTVWFLDASLGGSQPSTEGRQSMLASPGSYNFINEKQPVPQSAGMIDVEKLVRPVTPPGGGEGLTPGFWKTHSQYGPAPLAGWPETGYSPDDSYNAIFGVNYPGNPTLLQALSAGGGGYIALGRQSAAALLNAANPNIDYLYTKAQIIAMVQQAYLTGDYDTPKNLFEAQNELGADLTTPATGGTPQPFSDADTPTGPVVMVGQSVEFRYEVRNTGSGPISNVVLTDDNETPSNTADDFNPAPVLQTNTSYNIGDTNQDGLLDTTEVWIYTYSKVVTDGQHTNIATVTGKDVLTQKPLTDSDAANWLGFTETPPPPPVSKIDIEKYVKVVPPNSGNGGGEGLTPGFWKQSQHFYAWTGYTPSQSYNAVFGVNDPVGNGLTLLQALQRGGGGNAALGRHAVAAILNASNPNISYAYTVSQIIAMVQNAYATGNYEATKNLFAAENEKGADLTPGSTNGQTGGIGSDADSPTGPYALVGTQAVFTYLVTNPGQTALANVVVTDDRGTADPSDDFHPTFTGGDTNNNGLLDVGETWTYTAAAVVKDGQNYNLGSVVGTPVVGGLPVGSPVTDQDYAYWYGVTDTEPLTGGISGTKYRDVTGNGLSADDTPLAGVKVYLDANNSGTLDTGEVSTTTGSDGTYRFIGLTPGAYTVREVVPTGYIRTAPAVNDFYSVTVASGADQGGNNFANYQLVCQPSDVTNVSFLINNTTTVTDLRGNTREGDVVRATFTVTTAEARRFTLVSYTAPGATFDANTASQQRIYDLDTGVFTAGTYSLEVRIPSSFYQVDFVCGSVIDQLGPAGSNIFYTPQQRLISADNGGTRLMQADSSSLSGFVYVDANDDGFFGAERGIGGVTVTLTGTNSLGQAVSITRATDSSGGYIFDNLLPSASGYRITETQPSAYVDGKDTLGTLGGTVGNDVFSAIVLAASNNGTDYNFGERVTATLADLSGTVYVDANGNGSLDLNERGIQGVLIQLTGTDANGNSVSRTTYTDVDGDYLFQDLAAGTYRIEEVQPAGYLDGADTLGSLGGVLGSRAGTTVIDDVFEQIALNGVDGMWYNFGEKTQSPTGTAVHAGQTATIGFWRNKNGQALLLSLNGGATATKLGNWLATTFPNMFGAGAGTANLTNATNRQVAAAFQKWFAVKGQKLEAQVLAVAFAVYVTDSDLAGTVATKYGFEVTSTGLGAAYYNIGTSGQAFGVANYTQMKVLDILKATNNLTNKGMTLYNGKTLLRNLANTVYDGINNAGDIG